MSPDDLSAFMPAGWTGKLPPCLIQVSPEGELSTNGAPLIHPGILELIFASVHLEDGIYLLRVGKQECQLEVADTFFVVRSVSLGPEGATLTLNDGSTEALDPSGVWLGESGALYCRVKGGSFPARFNRQAHYQIAQAIVESGEGFALRLDGRDHAIASAPPA
ncbi:MAG: hypothetical protein LDL07_12110 [Desulfarculus sp.]|nr:hypothetical protein [Desulfarculus sp.]